MRWTIVKSITKIAPDLSNILIRKRPQYLSFEEYGNLPKGSLGNTFYKYLKKENISFKPNLIRHDLKHILRGYEMKMPDELRIHAFQMGNRYYNPMGITCLLLCCCIVPEIIPTLKKDFKRGRIAKRLKGIDLGKYLGYPFVDLQQHFRVA